MALHVGSVSRIATIGIAEPVKAQPAAAQANPPSPAVVISQEARATEKLAREQKLSASEHSERTVPLQLPNIGDIAPGDRLAILNTVRALATNPENYNRKVIATNGAQMITSLQQYISAVQQLVNSGFSATA